jgi:threonine dehydrogenase-like Zn-dependent dehydrogenase
VLVEIKACGVCASELHPWMGEVKEPEYPRRLGHEPAGIVREAGPGVTQFAPGDRVTGLFGKAYSDVQVVDEGRLLPLPPQVSFECGLGEPLACLVNAQRRTTVELADRVALIGLGFMGLGMLQLIKLRGPRQIVAVDVRAEARQQALALGASEAYHPAELPDDYLLTRWRDWQTSKGMDVVVEASGTQAGLALASDMVRAHGILSILGFHQGGMRVVDMEMWNWKAIDVVNAHVRRFNDLMESMRIGLELMACGLIDFAPFITHRYGLDGVDQAYADMRHKPPGFIKAVIVPAQE